MFSFKPLLFLGAIFSTNTLMAQSQVNLPLECSPAEPMIKELIGENYQEVPIILAQTKNKRSSIMILRNQKTSSWTILLIKGDDACMLAAGEGILMNLKEINANIY